MNSVIECPELSQLSRDTIERLFRRALELNPSNNRAQRNLKRVRDEIRQAEEQKRAIERAAHLYSQENVTVRRAIAKLYEERTENELTFCNLDRLSSVLKVHSTEADEWVEEFLQKKYFEEVENHGGRSMKSSYAPILS